MTLLLAQFRKYESFQGYFNQNYKEGIQFWTGNNVKIINYPQIHSKNLTQKHQQTQMWFKPVVRIFKNMRSKMIEKNLISRDTAPSYYVEGLIYNAPVDKFAVSYEDTVVNIINWISTTDRTKFVCANEQYFLCHPDSPVTWRHEKRDAFLNGAIQLWKEW